jgi:hypothetical protein
MRVYSYAPRVMNCVPFHPMHRPWCSTCRPQTASRRWSSSSSARGTGAPARRGADRTRGADTSSTFRGKAPRSTRGSAGGRSAERRADLLFENEDNFYCYFRKIFFFVTILPIQEWDLMPAYPSRRRTLRKRSKNDGNACPWLLPSPV